MAQQEPHNLSDDHTDKETLALADIIDALKAIGGDVFGIMHSTIDATQPGLDVLFGNWDGPVMAYPEALRPGRKIGEPNPSATPAEFASACRSYVESGVQIIGGCCGTTIEHIRAMVDALPNDVGQRRTG
jgi:methionine synthase I (cobalamin-dependent)